MISLTAATPAFATVLAELHAAAFSPEERWDAQAMGEMLALRGTFGWIAESDGFILARVAAGEAEILTLAVLPNRRRIGLGATLLAEAMREAAARGAQAVLLEVAEPNVAARALYAGFGFQEVGQRRHYYADGSDALVLRYDIGTA